MKLREAGTIILVVVGIVALTAFFSHKLIKTEHHTNKEEFRGHDNFVEEMGEGVVEKLLHLPEGSLDFTPISEEEVDKLNYPEEVAQAIKEFLKEKGKLKGNG